MMKILSWNIRGLNNLGKQRYLKDKLKKEKHDIMLLQETKISASCFEAILRFFHPHYDVMALMPRKSMLQHWGITTRSGP